MRLGLCQISEEIYYEGEWDMNRRSGRGMEIQMGVNGGIYEGYWKNDYKDGVGRWIGINQDYYEG